MRAVFLIVLGIVTGSTLSTTIALAWTAPTASPPGNNVSSPINTGATSQLKNGTLGVNALGVFGNTILNGTNGDNNGNGVNSYLNFGATAGQNGYGIRDNNGTLEFKSNSTSWGSLNATLVNLLTVNGITPNGLGQITSIKFGDGTTQTTAAAANPWQTSGTSIYYNGGNVGIGIASPIRPLTVNNGEISIIGFPSSSNAADIDISDASGNGSGSLTIRGLSQGGSASAILNGVTLYSTSLTVNGDAANGGNVFQVGPAGDFLVTGGADGRWGIYHGTWGNEAMAIEPGNSVTIDSGLTVKSPGPVGNGWGGRIVLYNTAPGIPAPMKYLRVDEGGNLSVVNSAATAGILSLSDAGALWIAGGLSQYSDARLKKNIQTFPNALQIVQQLRGVTFNWKKDGAPSAGVIAQEVEKVLPSAVSTDKETGMKSVEYSQLIAPMIEAIKEQQNEIDALTKKTDAQAQETDTQKLCISKSDGTKVCVTGDQLAALLASQANLKSQ